MKRVESTASGYFCANGSNWEQCQQSCAVETSELTEELLHVLMRKGNSFMDTISCINKQQTDGVESLAVRRRSAR